MRVGVFVGSFNPVHKGHIMAVNFLLDNDYLDKVMIIPTGNYWNKTNLIDINHRINMLKTYESEKILINDTLNSLEYTYLVLNELRKENKDLYLIIGDDNLVDFHLWKNIDEILLNKVIVLNRNNLDSKQHIEKFKNKEQFILIKNNESLNMSSTEIRNMISNNDKTQLDTYLDKKVLDYIDKNNLY